MIIENFWPATISTLWWMEMGLPAVRGNYFKAALENMLLLLCLYPVASILCEAASKHSCHFLKDQFLPAPPGGRLHRLNLVKRVFPFLHSFGRLVRSQFLAEVAVPNCYNVNKNECFVVLMSGNLSAL